MVIAFDYAGGRANSQGGTVWGGDSHFGDGTIGVGVGIGIGIDKTNGNSTPIPTPTPTPMTQ